MLGEARRQLRAGLLRIASAREEAAATQRLLYRLTRHLIELDLGLVALCSRSASSASPIAELSRSCCSTGHALTCVHCCWDAVSCKGGWQVTDTACAGELSEGQQSPTSPSPQQSEQGQQQSPVQQSSPQSPEQQQQQQQQAQPQQHPRPAPPPPHPEAVRAWIAQVHPSACNLSRCCIAGYTRGLERACVFLSAPRTQVGVSAPGDTVQKLVRELQACLLVAELIGTQGS